MKNLKVRLDFTDFILGTSPNNRDIYRDFIASKAPDAASVSDEIEAIGLEQYTEKGITVFPRNEADQPIFWDYQIKGFFKDACSMLARVGGKDPETGKKKKAVNESGKLTAYKKVIDGLVFVAPREIVIHYEGEMDLCQRPLRAQTPQGERVALAISERVPAGAWCEFTITILSDDLEPAVREWLDYGVLRGLGQWRNSGAGRFVWEEV